MSLNAIVGDDSGNKTEVGDLQEKMNLHPLSPAFSVEMDESQFENIIDNVRDIIEEFDYAVDSYRLSMLARLYILLTFRKSKVRQAVSSFKQYASLNIKEEQALDLLLLEIRNRLCLVS
jgi:hypothetical protein